MCGYHVDGPGIASEKEELASPSLSFLTFVNVSRAATTPSETAKGEKTDSAVERRL